MNLDIIFFFIFSLFILILILLNRKKLDIQKIFFPIYFVLYKTKIGLGLMDKIAKRFPRFISFLEFIIIPVSYLGMGIMLYFLAIGMYGFFFKGQPSPVRLLLPGIETPGLPKLSFLHWIIAIFILASVHEFAHGVLARLNKIKLNSSGFAVLSILIPIIPAAFVEPDEKELSSKSKRAQLAVLGAGSFANFLTAVLFFFIFSFLIVPFTDNMLEYSGVTVTGARAGFPAESYGLSIGEKILEVDGVTVRDVNHFISLMDKVKPSEKISLKTDKKNYNIVTTYNPEDKDKSYLGVMIQHSKQDFKEGAVNKYSLNVIKIFFWFRILVWWVYMTNIFVGLFNLLPLGPVDGGRIFYTTLLLLFKNNEKRSKSVWGVVSVILLTLILIALFPQLLEFLQFVSRPFKSLL